MSLANLELSEIRELDNLRKQYLLNMKAGQKIEFCFLYKEKPKEKIYSFISNGTSDQAYTIYGHLSLGNLEKTSIFCGLEISSLIRTGFKKFPLVD